MESPTDLLYLVNQINITSNYAAVRRDNEVTVHITSDGFFIIIIIIWRRTTITTLTLIVTMSPRRDILRGINDVRS